MPGTWWVALGLWLDCFFFCPSLCCEVRDASKMVPRLWVRVSTWILEGWPTPCSWEGGRFEGRGSAMECLLGSVALCEKISVKIFKTVHREPGYAAPPLKCLHRTRVNPGLRERLRWLFLANKREGNQHEIQTERLYQELTEQL